MEKRILKISFSKSGSGSITPKVSLPISWINEMGINQEDREISVVFKDKKIIIEKNIGGSNMEDMEQLIEMGTKVGGNLSTKEGEYFRTKVIQLTNGSFNVDMARELAFKMAISSEQPIPKLFGKSDEEISNNWCLMLSYFMAIGNEVIRKSKK